MDYIVLDIEFNGRKFTSDKPMEVIEIGAVRLDDKLRRVDEFSSLVKPVYFAKLNSFIRQKTGIEQAGIDRAPGFPAVIRDFIGWLGRSDSFLLLTWGGEDLKRIIFDTRMHGLDDAYWMSAPYYDLLKGYLRSKGLTNDVSVEAALRDNGFEPGAAAHRALEDAKMTADLFVSVFAGLDMSRTQLFKDTFTNAKERRLIKQWVRTMRSRGGSLEWEPFAAAFLQGKIALDDPRKAAELRECYAAEMAKPAPAKPAKAPDATQRFTNRVGHYVKYRPSYPQQAIDFLYDELGFAEATAIADVGSGTGIFTSLLLDRGSRVYAVEPNDAMREAAERQFADRPGFASRVGTAERTGLDDEAVDRIVCAQSFHWFDQDRTKAEFARVLRPDGIVALVWNNWHSALNPFTTDYEALLNAFGNDYRRVRHTNIQASDFERFFKDGVVHKRTFGNRQQFDLEGVQGRLLSSSYIPMEGEPQYDAMIDELRRIYAKHADENGLVTFDYVTDIYYGEL